MDDPQGPSAANVSPPVDDRASAFEKMTRVLRDRGCRCPLMWNGIVPVPATICDLQQPGVRECKVLAALPPVPAAPLDGDAVAGRD